MNIILAFLLSLSAIFGQAPAPIEEQTVPVEWVEDTNYPQLLGLDWLPYELALSGATVPSNVTFMLTNDHVLNCGAKLSDAGVGGCTTWMEDGSILVTVSPELQWSAWGNHILHHELGHVVLDSHDECAVEAYAHQFTTETLWSYPHCAGQAG